MPKTKCLYFGCKKDAFGGYRCCGTEHGYMLNMALNQLRDAADADSQRGPASVRELYRVEEAIYYSRI